MSFPGIWTQNPDPFGSVLLSAAIAAVPVLACFAMLGWFRLPGPVAGPLTALLALVVATAAFGMPYRLAALSAMYGALYGLFPIGWIVIAAVYLFDVTVHTGNLARIREAIGTVTLDRRLQALLVAFCFGAFLEGAAGFGTPVAISAAMLYGLGFRAVDAAGLSLVANTVPVAFAALGVPVLAAAEVSGLEAFSIARTVSSQLVVLAFLTPPWLVFLISGWRGMREVLPALFVCGATFAAVQWTAARLLGPALPAILGAVTAMAALIFFLRVWQPEACWRFAHDGETCRQPEAVSVSGNGGGWRSWTPFLLLMGMVTCWSLRPVARLLDGATVRWSVPGLSGAFKTAGAESPATVIYTFNWLSAAGTAIFLAALLSLALFRLPMEKSARLFAATVRKTMLPLLTIMSMLGFAFVANYSGMSTAMATGLTKVGKAYPFISPVLGWLGVFVTGSDTSANALFGGLQVSAAKTVGMDPLLAVAANTTGGVTGKMISPQSIAIATAATGLVGQESILLRFTWKHSVAFLLVVSLLTGLQAYHKSVSWGELGGLHLLGVALLVVGGGWWLRSVRARAMVRSGAQRGRRK